VGEEMTMDQDQSRGHRVWDDEPPRMWPSSGVARRNVIPVTAPIQPTSEPFGAIVPRGRYGMVLMRYGMREARMGPNDDHEESWEARAVSAVVPSVTDHGPTGTPLFFDNPSVPRVPSILKNSRAMENEYWREKSTQVGTLGTAEILSEISDRWEQRLLGGRNSR
jgi:hypothetical protein